MSGSRPDRVARCAWGWLRRRLRPGAEDGFILIESLIAITVITIVMSAVGAEFLGGMIASSQQRAHQVAVQLADSTMEQIQSLDPSDLVTGRDSTSVGSQFDKGVGVPAIKPGLCRKPMTASACEPLMDNATDLAVAADSGSAAAVPTTPTTTAAGSGSPGYTINQYLGWCSVLKTVASPALADCVKSSTSSLTSENSTKYLRAVVSVAWNGPRCLATCAYVTSTLLSAAADPTFRINAGAYAAPVVVARATQTSVINDTDVSLAMVVQNGTGVPPFTWTVSAGALPNGLVLNPTTGVISTSPPGPIGGAVQGPAGTYDATIKVTDAFQRSDTQPVTWIVKPALVLTTPSPQVTVVNKPATLVLAATGGDGPPYTFSIVRGLPPGLSLSPSTGVIAGTPTTVGVYTVTAKVFDVTNTRFDTVDFTWTVSYPPIAAANPAAQTDTLDTPINGVQLSASGGSGSYVWTDPSGSLPAGLTVSSSGLVTGTPTALTTAKQVTLTVSDPSAGAGYTTTVTFTWTVLPRPTVTAPANQTFTVGQPVVLGFTSTCPNTPCTYTLNNPPAGLSVTSAGVISGTPTTAGTFSSVTITVTDADGAVTTSTAFTISIKARPTITAPANRTNLLGDTVSLQLTSTCPNAPCSYALSGAPTGLSINSSGLVTGTVGGTVKTYTGVTATITDADGTAVTSSTFSWTVSYAPLTASSPGAQTETLNDPITPVQMSATGGSGAYVWSDPTSSLPAGLTVSSGGLVTGTPIALTTAKAVTLRVSDPTAGAGYTTTVTISWSVVARPTVTAPTNQTYSVGQQVALGFTSTCPNTPCTYTLNNPPAGLSIAGAGGISGTPTTAGTFSSVTITVTDAEGAATTSTAFTITVKARPTVTAPANQAFTVGQQVVLGFTSTCPNTPCTYTLNNPPAGLSVTSAGVISGTPTTTGTSASVSITVTDTAGEATTSTAFTISIKARPTITAPANQTNLLGDTVSLQLTSTCPNTPCSYALSGAPTGLSINSSGLVTGTVGGTAKTYTGITATITDAGGTAVTSSTFTWTVSYRPITVANPGKQVDTVTTAIRPLQLTATGGSGTYIWTNPTLSLPAGLTISSTGVVSGTPTTTNGAGTSVTLTVSDPTAGASFTTTVTFTWVIVAKPTVTSPGNQADTAGTNVSVQLATTCPAAPCSYAFGGTAPTGLVISSTGLITGSVGSTVKTYTGLTVVATDSDGATATSGTFSWTVNAAPTMANPGNRTTMRGAAVSVNMSAYDALGTSPYTFSATNLPTWLTIDPSTGVVTGTAPNVNSTTLNITVTVTDADGVSATSPVFRWNVTNLANTFGDQTTYNSSFITKDLDNTGTGGTAPYTYTQTGTGLPSWLTLSSTTGVISGTAPDVTNNSVKYGPITINMTDSVGATITLNQFYWYNSDLRTLTPLTKATSRNQGVTGVVFPTPYIAGGTTKTYTATGLPTGVTMSSTGTLTGSTTTAGTYNVSLTASDSVGATLTASIVWTVS
jgi:type II secretory pathway pseudopilin PulG